MEEQGIKPDQNQGLVLARVFFSRAFAVILLVLSVIALGITGGGIDASQALEKAALGWRDFSRWILGVFDLISFSVWQIDHIEKDVIIIYWLIMMPFAALEHISAAMRRFVLGLAVLLIPIAGFGNFEKSHSAGSFDELSFMFIGALVIAVAVIMFYAKRGQRILSIWIFSQNIVYAGLLLLALSLTGIMKLSL